MKILMRPKSPCIQISTRLLNDFYSDGFIIILSNNSNKPNLQMIKFDFITFTKL